MNTIMTIGILAQGSPPPPGAMSTTGLIAYVAIMFAMVYLILLRPQQRREKERKQMIAEVKKGNRIIFSGGIIGKVTLVKEKTVKVQVDENTKLEITRGAIAGIIKEGEEIQEPETTR